MSIAKVTHVNPDELVKNPAFTNVVTVEGSGKTIYLGEINANNADGEVVGKGDMAVQAQQIMKNIQSALYSVGADWQHVIKWTVYVLKGQDPRPGFEAFQQYWGKRTNPPAVTMLFVCGLSNPDYLMGMEAMAIVP
ncbi:RidA family protein [Chitinophaga horti]|uniref:RidA family protein n=1 Tax=Chitinophaga horti TaxID=2920382 RepID=A0ABY6J3N6_9BACT|nr:RidA family protein [Chitinophaga horti]UYQ94198.1 RidA family protein [Chitinophaga horti]